jgi:acylglycerol lipase
MGGGLALAFATRSPSMAGLDKIKGVLSSSPLLRQAKGVKTPLLIVKAGSLVGKISGKLTMKAEVKPEVSFVSVPKGESKADTRSCETQDVCRDPEIQVAYAKDPLCVQVGSFRGISDMLLGVRAFTVFFSIDGSLISFTRKKGEALITKDYMKWPVGLPLLIVHGDGDKAS